MAHRQVREKIETLWYAADDGDEQRVAAILEEGMHDADGNNYWQGAIDPRGWGRTPLHAAVLNGHFGVAQLLLDRGADPTIASKYGDTPLHFAVASRHKDMVRALVAAGADPLAGNDDDETPTLLAERTGDADLLAILQQSAP